MNRFLRRRLNVAMLTPALVWLACAPFAVTTRGQDFDEEEVPEGTCILELNLPDGATVNVDGRDYGTKRRITYTSLESGKTLGSKVNITFSGGQREDRKVLVEGGQRIRFASAGPPGSRPQLIVPTGSFGGIRAMSLTEDGRHLLTASSLLAVLWDVATGRQLCTFHLDKGIIMSAAISPDGRHVAVGGGSPGRGGGEVIVWDAVTGQRQFTFDSTPGAIEAVTFHPACQQLLVGTEDGKAIFLEAATGQELRTLEAPPQVTFVAFDAVGKRVLTGSHLWDATTGKKLHSLGGPYRVGAAAISRDGERVLTADSRLVIMWDASTGKRVRVFAAPRGNVGCVALSADGHQMIMGTYDFKTKKGSAILFDLTTGRQIRSFPQSCNPCCAVFTPDGRHVFTISVDGASKPYTYATLYDTSTGTKVRTFRGQLDREGAIGFSHDGRQVLTFTIDGAVSFWDLARGKKPRTIYLDGFEFPGLPKLDPDGTLLLLRGYSHDSQIHIRSWDTATGERLRTLNMKEQGPISSMDLSPDRRQLLTSTYEDTAVLWDTSSGEKIRTFEVESGKITRVAFTPDSDQVVTNTYDFRKRLGAIIFWDAATGERLRTIPGFSGLVDRTTFSPGGDKLVSCSTDTTPPQPASEAILWDLATGQRLRTFNAGQGHFLSAAFSPDARWLLASVGPPGKSILWDVDTGAKLQELPGAASMVPFSRSGRYVLIGNRDGLATLSDMATAKELVHLLNLNNGKDWAVVTPEGLFDGTKGGRESLQFRSPKTLEIISAGQLPKSYYCPGLLSAIWRGERPMPP